MPSSEFKHSQTQPRAWPKMGGILYRNEVLKGTLRGVAGFPNRDEASYIKSIEKEKFCLSNHHIFSIS
jgi:hypothetical protein